MDPKIKTLICENQRLQANLTLLKNASTTVRNDLEKDQALSLYVTSSPWIEFDECIKATPDYCAQAIGQAAQEDFARWMGANMGQLFAAYLEACEQAAKMREAEMTPTAQIIQ